MCPIVFSLPSVTCISANPVTSPSFLPPSPLYVCTCTTTTPTTNAAQRNTHTHTSPHLPLTPFPPAYQNPSQKSQPHIPTNNRQQNKTREKKKKERKKTMASTAAAGLLSRQLKSMQTSKDAIPGISVGLISNNVFEWEVMLMISDDCKYYGGMCGILSFLYAD